MTTHIRTAVAGLWRRVRSPKTTVRWRLTLLYGGLFLASGLVLLVITYTLVNHAQVVGSPGRQISAPTNFKTVPGVTIRGHVTRATNGTLPPGLRQLLKSSAGKFVIDLAGTQQRVADLHQLLVESAIALAIMAILSTLLGWVVAGRVLAPLRTMTATTRQISERNLHQRLALEGPPDELRLLADTIDGLLARLEAAFDAQRRFVANASHELRTPLTAARALLELALTDPHATIDSFRTTCRQVLQENEYQEQLIEALLTLAQSQRGLNRRDPLQLDAIASEVLDTRTSEATARGLRVYTALAPVRASGDRRLVAQLIANLVDNAIRHNVAHGELGVRVALDRGEAVLTVQNTGPPVPPDEIERLLQPFQRLGVERAGDGDGLGLGLSIVAAIAAAHDATLRVRPASPGGLVVQVRFPRAAAPTPALAPAPAGDAAVVARSLS